jgi:hypothetical protein
MAHAAKATTSTAMIRVSDFFIFLLSHNTGDQRLATKGLSTPPDFIASPLHRFVRL